MAALCGMEDERMDGFHQLVDALKEQIQHGPVKPTARNFLQFSIASS